MTWVGARGALTTLITNLGYRVVHLSPSSAEAVSAVTVVIAPPPRQSERMAGVRITTYAQRLDVIAPVGESADAAALDVDAAAEAIDAALDRSITFGGEATSVSPVEWEGVEPLEVPEDSGTWFAAMRGVIQIEVETIAAFAA